MYWLALNELSTLDLRKKIVLGAELSATSLQAYGTHLHNTIFPPSASQRSKVHEVVGDGRTKVHEKC